MVKNLDTGEQYGEGYDKLILSPGAEPATHVDLPRPEHLVDEI
jgi:hypothetical protein